MLLNLLTVLIVASSMSFHVDYSPSFIETSKDSLRPLPQIGDSPLTTLQSKMSDKFFTPLINFVESSVCQKRDFENLTFLYYRPLYSLFRLKKFFLII
jgi:hypothetical protein